jgi:signal transduction histidine kinase
MMRLTQLGIAGPFSAVFSAVVGGQRGAGLGLAICRSIAEAHSGRIMLQSAPARGTTAAVALPL